MGIALALEGVGCGGSNGGGGGGAPIAMGDYVPALIDKDCTRSVACGQTPDKATCIAASSIDLGNLFAAVSAGKTRYDGTAAATCIAAGRASTACTMTAQASVPSDPACAQIFNGTLAEGAACSQGDECLSGSCNITSCSGTPPCCMGTCDPAAGAPVPIGGDCSAPGASCVADAFCRITTGLCVQVIAAGLPCDPTMGDFCAPGLNCVPDASLTQQVCTRPPAEGEACTASSPCDALGDFCDPTTMKCAPKIAVGRACASGVGCVDYARCDSASGTCVARGKAGQSCAVNDPMSCLGSLRCTAATTCALSAAAPTCP